VNELGIADVVETILFFDNGIDPRVEAGEVAYLSFDLGLVEAGGRAEEIGSVPVVRVVQYSVLQAVASSRGVLAEELDLPESSGSFLGHNHLGGITRLYRKHRELDTESAA
jgi:hypothetical protein